MNEHPTEANPAKVIREGVKAGRELLLLSTAVLFLELAIIRWGGMRVRALAYFPNLLLIGSFLGLGLGCLRVAGRSLASWWMPSLAVLALAFTGPRRIVVTQESNGEHPGCSSSTRPKTSLSSITFGSLFSYA